MNFNQEYPLVVFPREMYERERQRDIDSSRRSAKAQLLHQLFQVLDGRGGLELFDKGEYTPEAYQILKAVVGELEHR